MGLALANQSWSHNRSNDTAGALPEYNNPHIIGRALRAANPGVVFARAALRQEADPLQATVTRIFAGMEPS